jgi:hypothetical protein
MRSDLVFGALIHVSNRFLLSRTLARATREFHRPGTRIEDTTNQVLARFGHANPIPANNSIQAAAIVSLRHRSPQPVVRPKTSRLTVPAIQGNSHPLSEALRVFGA